METWAVVNVLTCRLRYILDVCMHARLEGRPQGASVHLPTHYVTHCGACVELLLLHQVLFLCMMFFVCIMFFMSITFSLLCITFSPPSSLYLRSCTRWYVPSRACTCVHLTSAVYMLMRARMRVCACARLDGCAGDIGRYRCTANVCKTNTDFHPPAHPSACIPSPLPCPSLSHTQTHPYTHTRTGHRGISRRRKRTGSDFARSNTEGGDSSLSHWYSGGLERHAQRAKMLAGCKEASTRGTCALGAC